MSLAHKRRRQRLKDLGLCARCGKDVATRGYECIGCAEKQLISARAYKNKRREERRCVRCGVSDILPTKKDDAVSLLCEKCYLKHAAQRNLNDGSAWKQLKEKLVAQDYRCAYTGEKLVLGVNASVEHILPKSRFPEYAEDINNIEWTTLTVNLAKRELTRDEFIALVRQIGSYV